jgi:hypothetical protein
MLVRREDQPNRGAHDTLGLNTEAALPEWSEQIRLRIHPEMFVVLRDEELDSCPANGNRAREHIELAPLAIHF